MTSPTRTQVFISYSHRDKQWLERLQVHLKPFVRDGLFDYWDDTRIRSGQKWQEEIERALAATKVAVLLISADFLASDFIVTQELPHLLDAAESEGATILPVIIGPSQFESSLLKQFQAANSPSKPLRSLSKGKQEEVFVKIAQDVRNTINPP